MKDFDHAPQWHTEGGQSDSLPAEHPDVRNNVASFFEHIVLRGNYAQVFRPEDPNSTAVPGDVIGYDFVNKTPKDWPRDEQQS